MQRPFFILLFVSLIVLEASAQKRDTLVYYLKKWVPQKSVDSADFTRVVISPDPTEKGGLFTVADFYPNGKKKMSGKAGMTSYVAHWNGPVISYYPNGRRESIVNYQDGALSGQAITYYPNGQLYAIKKTENRQTLLVECHDTTGKVLAENGNGTWRDLTGDHQIAYQQGPIVKGIRQGTWIKFIDGKELPFEYRDGKIALTVNYKLTGEIVSKPDIPASTPDERDGFLDFIQKSTRYPGIARENLLTGVVWVTFIVEKDGSLSDVKVSKSASKSMDDEVVRVVTASPARWIPGFLNGKAVRTLYNFAVCFQLEGLPPVQSPPGSVVVTAGSIRMSLR